MSLVRVSQCIEVETFAKQDDANRLIACDWIDIHASVFALASGVLGLEIPQLEEQYARWLVLEI